MVSQGSVTNTTGYVNYIYNISARGTSQVASQLLGLSGIAGNILGQIAFQTSSYLSTTEGALLSLGVVASAGLTKATKFAAEFNQEMETVHAISGKTVTTLADDAMEMSNKFGVALSDMTKGLEALARAGVSTGNMTTILEQAMGLSKLEGIPLEKSINSLISTTNLLDINNLDLESPEYAEAVKYQTQKITATSEAAPINANDIIHTLEHIGGYASSTRLDQDDLYAVIAQLGSKGTKSEMAGTSLRAFIAAGQKDTAQRALKRIGLDVKDLWKDDETIMSISDMKDVLDEAMEARGYTQQEKLEFYSDFAGYKQANQIMKIDTTSVREFKDKIDRSWDTSKKMQTVLDTAQTNLQSLMQTGINFLTKVGEPLLPIVSTVAKVLKTIIDVVDAVPFSNWIVAGGLMLVSVKSISTIFNKVGPQLLSHVNTVLNIRDLWADTKESIKESYDILSNWRNISVLQDKEKDIEFNRITDEDKLQFYQNKGYKVKNYDDVMKLEWQIKPAKDSEIRDFKRENAKKLAKLDNEGKSNRDKNQSKSSSVSKGNDFKTMSENISKIYNLLNGTEKASSDSTVQMDIPELSSIKSGVDRIVHILEQSIYKWQFVKEQKDKEKAQQHLDTVRERHNRIFSASREARTKIRESRDERYRRGRERMGHVDSGVSISDRTWDQVRNIDLKTDKGREQFMNIKLNIQHDGSVEGQYSERELQQRFAAALEIAMNETHTNKGQDFGTAKTNVTNRLSSNKMRTYRTVVQPVILDKKEERRIKELLDGTKIKQPTFKYGIGERRIETDKSRIAGFLATGSILGQDQEYTDYISSGPYTKKDWEARKRKADQFDDTRTTHGRAGLLMRERLKARAYMKEFEDKYGDLDKADQENTIVRDTWDRKGNRIKEERFDFLYEHERDRYLTDKARFERLGREIELERETSLNATLKDYRFVKGREPLDTYESFSGEQARAIASKMTSMGIRISDYSNAKNFQHNASGITQKLVAMNSEQTLIVVDEILKAVLDENNKKVTQKQKDELIKYITGSGLESDTTKIGLRGEGFSTAKLQALMIFNDLKPLNNKEAMIEALGDSLGNTMQEGIGDMWDILFNAAFSKLYLSKGLDPKIRKEFEKEFGLTGKGNRYTKMATFIKAGHRLGEAEEWMAQKFGLTNVAATVKYDPQSGRFKYNSHSQLDRNAGVSIIEALHNVGENGYGGINGLLLGVARELVSQTKMSTKDENIRKIHRRDANWMRKNYYDQEPSAGDYFDLEETKKRGYIALGLSNLDLGHAFETTRTATLGGNKKGLENTIRFGLYDEDEEREFVPYEKQREWMKSLSIDHIKSIGKMPGLYTGALHMGQAQSKKEKFEPMLLSTMINGEEVITDNIYRRKGANAENNLLTETKKILNTAGKNELQQRYDDLTYEYEGKNPFVQKETEFQEALKNMDEVSDELLENNQKSINTALHRFKTYDKEIENLEADLLMYNEINPVKLFENLSDNDLDFLALDFDPDAAQDFYRMWGYGEGVNEKKLHPNFNGQRQMIEWESGDISEEMQLPIDLPGIKAIEAGYDPNEFKTPLHMRIAAAKEFYNNQGKELPKKLAALREKQRNNKRARLEAIIKEVDNYIKDDEFDKAIAYLTESVAVKDHDLLETKSGKKIHEGLLSKVRLSQKKKEYDTKHKEYTQWKKANEKKRAKFDSDQFWEMEEERKKVKEEIMSNPDYYDTQTVVTGVIQNDKGIYSDYWTPHKDLINNKTSLQNTNNLLLGILAEKYGYSQSDVYSGGLTKSQQARVDQLFGEQGFVGIEEFKKQFGDDTQAAEEAMQKLRAEMMITRYQYDENGKLTKSYQPYVLDSLGGREFDANTMEFLDDGRILDYSAMQISKEEFGNYVKIMDLLDYLSYQEQQGVTKEISLKDGNVFSIPAAYRRTRKVTSLPDRPKTGIPASDAIHYQYLDVGQDEYQEQVNSLIQAEDWEGLGLAQAANFLNDNNDFFKYLNNDNEWLEIEGSERKIAEKLYDEMIDLPQESFKEAMVSLAMIDNVIFDAFVEVAEERKKSYEELQNVMDTTSSVTKDMIVNDKPQQIFTDEELLQAHNDFQSQVKEDLQDYLDDYDIYDGDFYGELEALKHLRDNNRHYFQDGIPFYEPISNKYYHDIEEVEEQINYMEALEQDYVQDMIEDAGFEGDYDYEDVYTKNSRFNRPTLSAAQLGIETSFLKNNKNLIDVSEARGGVRLFFNPKIYDSVVDEYKDRFIDAAILKTGRGRDLLDWYEKDKEAILNSDSDNKDYELEQLEQDFLREKTGLLSNQGLRNAVWEDTVGEKLEQYALIRSTFTDSHVFANAGKATYMADAGKRLSGVPEVKKFTMVNKSQREQMIEGLLNTALFGDETFGIDFEQLSNDALLDLVIAYNDLFSTDFLGGMSEDIVERADHLLAVIDDIFTEDMKQRTNDPNVYGEAKVFAEDMYAMKDKIFKIRDAKERATELLVDTAKDVSDIDKMIDEMGIDQIVGEMNLDEKIANINTLEAAKDQFYDMTYQYANTQNAARTNRWRQSFGGNLEFMQGLVGAAGQLSPYGEQAYNEMMDKKTRRLIAERADSELLGVAQNVKDLQYPVYTKEEMARMGRIDKYGENINNFYEGFIALHQLASDKISQQLTDIEKIFDTDSNNKVIKQTELFGDKLEGVVGNLTLWKDAISDLSATFPPLQAALIGLEVVIGGIKKIEVINAGIASLMNLKQSMAKSGGIELFGKTIMADSNYGKIIQIAIGGLGAAVTTLESIIMTFAGPLVVIAGALFAFSKALKWSQESYNKWLKELEENNKETRSKSIALQTNLKTARNQFEKNNDQNKEANLRRNYELAQARLANANMARAKNAIDLSNARNDILWGNYGISAGLGKIQGKYESTAADYEGSSEQIRRIKEGSLGNIFATGSMQMASAYYDRNRLAIAQIDEYKDELGKLYDTETGMMRRVGPGGDARKTPEFQKALDEFVEATGITRDHAQQYLDYMQTEHNVDKATQAMQAQADKISAMTEMKIQAISFGGNPSDVLGLNGIEAQQSAMVKAQADMIKLELSGQLFWKATWATITAPLKLVISPIFAMAHLLAAIWAFITGNWTTAWDQAGQAVGSFDVTSQAMTYWGAWAETESTDFSSIGQSNIDNQDRMNYGNAATSAASGSRPHMPGPSRSDRQSLIQHNERTSVLGNLFGGVTDLLSKIVNILMTALVGYGVYKAGSALLGRKEELGALWNYIKDVIPGKNFFLDLKDSIQYGGLTSGLKNIGQSLFSYKNIEDTLFSAGEKGKGLFGGLKKKALGLSIIPFLKDVIFGAESSQDGLNTIFEPQLPFDSSMVHTQQQNIFDNIQYVNTVSGGKSNANTPNFFMNTGSSINPLGVSVNSEAILEYSKKNNIPLKSLVTSLLAHEYGHQLLGHINGSRPEIDQDYMNVNDPFLATGEYEAELFSDLLTSRILGYSLSDSILDMMEYARGDSPALEPNMDLINQQVNALDLDMFQATVDMIVKSLLTDNMMNDVGVGGLNTIFGPKNMNGAEETYIKRQKETKGKYGAARRRAIQRAKGFSEIGDKSKYLGDMEGHAHHLNGYNWYEEGRADESNLIYLSDKVHNEFHKMYGYGNNTIDQFLEFLARRYPEDVPYFIDTFISPKQSIAQSTMDTIRNTATNNPDELPEMIKNLKYLGTFGDALTGEPTKVGRGSYLPSNFKTNFAMNKFGISAYGYNMPAEFIGHEDVWDDLDIEIRNGEQGLGAYIATNQGQLISGAIPTDERKITEEMIKGKGIKYSSKDVNFMAINDPRILPYLYRSLQNEEDELYHMEYDTFDTPLRYPVENEDGSVDWVESNKPNYKVKNDTLAEMLQGYNKKHGYKQGDKEYLATTGSRQKLMANIRKMRERERGYSLSDLASIDDMRKYANSQQMQYDPASNDDYLGVFTGQEVGPEGFMDSLSYQPTFGKSNWEKPSRLGHWWGKTKYNISRKISPYTTPWREYLNSKIPNKEQGNDFISSFTSPWKDYIRQQMGGPLTGEEKWDNAVASLYENENPSLKYKDLSKDERDAYKAKKNKYLTEKDIEFLSKKHGIDVSDRTTTLGKGQSIRETLQQDDDNLDTSLKDIVKNRIQESYISPWKKYAKEQYANKKKETKEKAKAYMQGKWNDYISQKRDEIDMLDSPFGKGMENAPLSTKIMSKVFDLQDSLPKDKSLQEVLQDPEQVVNLAKDFLGKQDKDSWLGQQRDKIYNAQEILKDPEKTMDWIRNNYSGQLDKGMTFNDLLQNPEEMMKVIKSLPEDTGIKQKIESMQGEEGGIDLNIGDKIKGLRSKLAGAIDIDEEEVEKEIDDAKKDGKGKGLGLKDTAQSLRQKLAGIIQDEEEETEVSEDEKPWQKLHTVDDKQRKAMLEDLALNGSQAVQAQLNTLGETDEPENVRNFKRVRNRRWKRERKEYNRIHKKDNIYDLMQNPNLYQEGDEPLSQREKQLQFLSKHGSQAVQAQLEIMDHDYKNPRERLQEQLDNEHAMLREDIAKQKEDLNLPKKPQNALAKKGREMQEQANQRKGLAGLGVMMDDVQGTAEKTRLRALKICPECGFENDSDSTHCINCGARLDGKGRIHGALSDRMSMLPHQLKTKGGKTRDKISDKIPGLKEKMGNKVVDPLKSKAGEAKDEVDERTVGIRGRVLESVGNSKIGGMLFGDDTGEGLLNRNGGLSISNFNPNIGNQGELKGLLSNEKIGNIVGRVSEGESVSDIAKDALLGEGEGATGLLGEKGGLAKGGDFIQNLGGKLAGQEGTLGKIGGAMQKGGKGLGKLGKGGMKGLGRIGGKALSKVGSKLASKGLAQVGSKVLGGALMATGIGAPLGLLLESPLGGFLMEGAMNLGGQALGAIGGAVGGIGKAIFGGGGSNMPGGGGLLGGLLKASPLGMLGGLVGGAAGLGKAAGGILGGIGGAVTGGLGGMFGGLLGLGGGAKGGAGLMKAAGPFAMVSVLRGMKDVAEKHFEVGKKQKDSLDKIATNNNNATNNNKGGNITIQNININTDDDPEAIKAMFLDLIVELQEQVNPRLVSRTTGSSNVSTNDSSEQTDTNSSQQQQSSGSNTSGQN